MMNVEWEHTEPEGLRSTPEGELWISVLVDAFNVLDVAIEWRRRSYPRAYASLEQDYHSGKLARPRYRLRRRELERERRNRESQISSCIRFFFDEDSPLAFICDARNPRLLVGLGGTRPDALVGRPAMATFVKAADRS
jgi:hypothetical protein